MNFDGVGPKIFLFKRILCRNNEGENKFIFICEEI